MFIICSVAVPRNLSQRPSFIYTALEDSPCPKDLQVSFKNQSNKTIPMHFLTVLRNKSIH